MRRCVCGFLVFILCIGVRPALAQEAPAIPVAPRDTADRITPTGAFIRSLIVPGWGQARAGAYRRGGVFFAIQSASWYMLLKTLSRLQDAHEIEDNEIAFVADSLRARMGRDTTFNRLLSDPAVFQRHIDDAPKVKSIRSLIDSREEQRQDWITYTIFFTLASGVDAFVAAHLSDFPARISAPPAQNGAVQLKFTVPLQRRP